MKSWVPSLIEPPSLGGTIPTPGLGHNNQYFRMKLFQYHYDAVFTTPEILYQIWSLNIFLNSKLHMILKLSNLEIGEHSSFFRLFFKFAMEFRHLKIIKLSLLYQLNISL